MALGGDPALMLSAIIPLPEGIDEAGFAGVMRGRATPMTRAKTVDVRVPAHAEFVIEGQLQPARDDWKVRSEITSATIRRRRFPRVPCQGDHSQA